MKRLIPLVLLLPAARPPAAAAQVTAEHFFRPGTVAVGVGAGGAAFSPFQRALEQPDTGMQPFERRVAAGTSAVVAADLTWWGGKAWGVRAHASYMPSRFAVRYDRAGEDWLRTRSGSGEPPTYASLGIWLADLSLLLRPPFALGRLAPYGIIGGGVVSYRPRSGEGLPPEAEAAFADGTRTTAAAVAGVGGLVPLQRGGLLLSFALTDHLTRTPVPRGRETGDARDPRTGSAVQAERSARPVRVTSTVRLLVGLTIPLRAR